MVLIREIRALPSSLYLLTFPENLIRLRERLSRSPEEPARASSTSSSLYELAEARETASKDKAESARLHGCLAEAQKSLLREGMQRDEEASNQIHLCV